MDDFLSKVSINHNVIPYKGQIPKDTYHQFCENIYSQNGEDGIIAQLLNELQIEKGYFCEFGASDGISSSNTFQLVQKGWKGMCIEPDPQRFSQLEKNYEKYTNILCFQGYVQHNNSHNSLDSWLSNENFPTDLDVLSIDIDKDDYFVWEKFQNYRPKIVLIETNAYRDPIMDELPDNRIPKPDEIHDILIKTYPGRIGTGASFMSIIKLGLSKGYVPLAYTGNITFIDKKYIDKLKIFPYLLSKDPYDYVDLYTNLVLWKNGWYTNNLLIYNVAIRNFFKKHGEYKIDFDWILENMNQINNIL